jgi:hypothetical protein
MARVRSDSITTAVKSAQAASLGAIQPLAHTPLRDADFPFWDAIVLARAAGTWTNSDLVLAANLARCQSDIVRLQIDLEVEGDVSLSQKGTPVVNPKHALIETLSRRAVALSRALHVHAEATQGRSRDAGNKLGAEQSARDVVQDDEDGLIPRLRAV